MKQTMVTVNFSVDRKIQEDLDLQAASEGRSKSDIFREMYKSYKFNRTLDAVQIEGRKIMLRLGLETDDDIVRYMDEN